MTTETLSEYDLAFSYVLVFDDDADPAGAVVEPGIDPGTNQADVKLRLDVEDGGGGVGSSRPGKGCQTMGCCKKAKVDDLTLRRTARDRMLEQLEALGLRLFKLRGRVCNQCLVLVVADQELLETFAEATRLHVPLATPDSSEAPGGRARDSRDSPAVSGFTVHVPFARAMKRLLDGGSDWSATCEDCRSPAAPVSKGSRHDVVFKRRWCTKCAVKHDDAIDLFQFDSNIRSRWAGR